MAAAAVFYQLKAEVTFMGSAISILLLGISFGLVYFLLAAGMTLTMGLLRVVNMSHGAIFLFSGY